VGGIGNAPPKKGPINRGVTTFPDRAERLRRVSDKLDECLAELRILGLTLPAALVDNAIAEIKHN
jgi:hypothetical protein